jgi:hypothetical protein
LPRTSDCKLAGAPALLFPESLEILLGKRPDAHLTHSVASPEHLFVRKGEGREEDLEIESADGTRTLLRIRAASLSGSQTGPGAR